MQWFEDDAQYTEDIPVPAQLQESYLSLVKCYPNGTTQPGWGAKDFVTNMDRDEFRPSKALDFYERHNQPFAFVMRSVPFICVDIDGKNDGIRTAQLLGLAPTLAERSKSGTGYHLFYRVPYTNWNALRGFDEFPDLIGLVPGVDIKSTGLVYHYPHQRWNNTDIALIPPSLAELIGRVRDVKRAARITRDGTKDLDPDEMVIIHDQLRDELKSNFPVGNRNNRLYAIGAQMMVTNYPAWDTALYDRGVELGLELQEVSDIIRNIQTYV